jgi:hypothetical protein
MILDLATGYLIASNAIPEGGIFSPSQLGRLIILLYFVALILHSREISLWFVFGITPFILIELLYGAAHGQLTGLLYGLISAAKLAVLAAPFFVTFDELDQREIVQSFKLGALLMASVIVTSLVFDIGKPTYPSGGFGTKSFFPSGNDIGAYLGGATLLLIVARYYQLIKLSNISVAILLTGLTFISSKASLLFMLASILFLVYHSRLMIPVAVLVAVFVFYYSDPLSQTAAMVGEIIVRRYNEADGDWIRFLLSGRELYVNEALQRFNEQNSTVRLLFGQGIFVGPQHLNQASQVDFLEADPFDIFFMFGTFGVIVFVLFWWHLIKMSKAKAWFAFPLTLLLLHSSLAGHVVFSGLFLQTVIVATVLLKRKRQDELTPIDFFIQSQASSHAR